MYRFWHPPLVSLSRNYLSYQRIETCMKKSELENGENYVECADCGHIVSTRTVQTVYHPYGSTSVYCSIHKKPYTRVMYSMFGGGLKYFGEVEMTADGTPIGYKKIVKKKK